MLQRKKRSNPEINASSMADIAFLLLIFFLVTTTIASDKGINMFLPPYVTEQTKVELDMDDVFTININSADKLMVEDELMTAEEVKAAFLKFMEKHGKPQDAIVSIKGDRGTTYEVYHRALDQVKTGYFELRAKNAGISYERYMSILNAKKRTKEEEDIYEKTKDAIPLQISEAEPSKIGG